MRRRKDTGDVHLSATAEGDARVYQSVGDLTVYEVNLRTGALVRTRYRHQVRRIAPDVLVGRDDELARTAEFCASPGGGYLWWQAGPWAGKSALLSWFVLHPPEGVRVVSFFVTARLAGQNDRGAFVDNVVEQLLALLGAEAPPLLNTHTREQHLLGLLDEAAALCQARGERLVLVVDGLDEDASVTEGPDAHSIAALLPRRPEALRVVVGGRPDPPVPQDVPDDHPLRAPAIVAVLEPSPHARALRADMERDLKRLLRGGDAEQDLLGLVTAAGGGLGAEDLAALAGRTEWEVHDLLRTVVGRSFARRPGRFAPDGGTDRYLLGHEELQVTAQEMLGPARLAGYRDRVHAWADEHRDRGWPPTTPEYLLGGYHALLLATGDLDRAAVLSVDPRRQHRMLHVSGSRTTARAEITAVLAALAARPEPDVATLARLALHRDRLTDRDRVVDIEIPALWAALGHVDRAEFLAVSIEHPHWQAQSLGRVAEAVATGGDPVYAGILLDRATGLLDTITHPMERVWARAVLARAAVAAGQRERAVAVVTDAVTLACDIEGDDRDDARSAAAEALASVGLFRAAAALVASPRTYLRSSAAATVAVAAAEAGDHAVHAEVLSTLTHPYHRARALCASADRGAVRAEISRLVAMLTDAGERARARAAFAEASAADGDHQLARVLLDEAVISALDYLDHQPLWAMETLRDVAGSAARAGEDGRVTGLLDLATGIARTVHLGARFGATVQVALAALRTGHRDRAAGLLDEATDLTRSVADADHQLQVLAELAAAARVADPVRRTALFAQAADITAATLDVDDRCGQLADLAVAAHDATEPDTARALLDQAALLAHGASDPGDRGRALAQVARGALHLGDGAGALALARAIPETDERDRALAAVVTGLAHDSALADAGALADAAALAGEIADPAWRGLALVTVAVGRFDAGLLDRGVALIRSEPDLPDRARALSWAVQALYGIGNRATGPAATARRVVTGGAADPAGPLTGLTVTLLDEAATAAAGIDTPFQRDSAAVFVVEAAARTGHDDVAVLVANTVTDGFCRDMAVATLAEVAVEHGDLDRAASLTRFLTGASAHATQRLALARATAATGDLDAAAAMAADIRHPRERGEAYAAVAVAAARAGHHAETTRYTVAALVSGLWTAALHVLPETDPPALAHLLDDVLLVTHDDVLTTPVPA